MTTPTPLHYITRRPLTELDMLNIKAAKAEATDVLVQLKPAHPGCEYALAFGYGPDDNDLPTGVTFACVARPHHATLVQAIRLCVEGDVQWESVVWNVEMIGGK